MRSKLLLIALAVSLSMVAARTASAQSDDRPIIGLTIPIEASEILPVAPEDLRANRLLYLNRCVGGETVSGCGYNDSSTNCSSIINGTKQFPAFPYGDASWDQVVAHTADIYAPFAITVTDVDPGSAAHHEVIVCGSPTILGMDSNVGGVSPFYNCSVINKSISFVFPTVWGNVPRGLGETVAHEAGHAFGLEDEYLCTDPMTYLTGCGDKYFQDEYANCGGFTEESCWCGGQQNSWRILMNNIGASDPTPPQITITEPANNANVNQGFVVRVTIEDDSGIDWAKLRIDDVDVQTLTFAPFAFNAPVGLSDGSHKVEIQAADAIGAIGSSVIYVIIGEPCGGPGDCATGETCIDGRCVPGPDTAGGLGSECVGPENCLNGMCLEGAPGVKYCTDTCAVATQGCPSGFVCLDYGSDGVCMPGDDGGGGSGGCSVATADRGQSWAWLWLCGLVGLILVRIRRRPPVLRS